MKKNFRSCSGTVSVSFQKHGRPHQTDVKAIKILLSDEASVFTYLIKLEEEERAEVWIQLPSCRHRMNKCGLEHFALGFGLITSQGYSSQKILKPSINTSVRWRLTLADSTLR